MFGFPAQTLNRADDLAGLGIEGSDALAAAVSRKNALGFSVEQNDVRVRSDGDSLDNRKGLQIEDDDRTWIAATDKTAPKIFGNRDAVNIGPQGSCRSPHSYRGRAPPLRGHGKRIAVGRHYPR
jgi:hypothetical protein